jgi:hypothetical protein
VKALACADAAAHIAAMRLMTKRSRSHNKRTNPIADSALKDGQVQLSPTAAHISHSGGQPTAPQVSTRSDKHDTVR